MNPRIPNPARPPDDATRDPSRHHDRLKDQWPTWFWTSMSLAIAVHFAVFVLSPDFHARTLEQRSLSTISVDVPPEVDIPPPPAALARPAAPRIAGAEISEDITIAPTTFEANPVDFLPPPPPTTTTENARPSPKFTPYSVAPVLLNRAEVQAMLEREYPPMLREAEVDGLVLIWLKIDTEGMPVAAEVKEPSGYITFDQVALRVGQAMRFRPAYNRDKKVDVWVALPIEFSVRR